MSDSNIVVFKGTKDGIVVILDENADFDEIITALEKKAADSGSFFDGSSISVSFKGRGLSLEEEDTLLEVIADAGIEIKEVYPDKPPKYGEEATNTVPFIRRTGNVFVSAKQNDTIYYRSSLRSGQSIKHAGSIVVMGDVNPGGELIAEGNIIVMGSLKGVAHAGSKGNNECFVAALNLVPSQLRIGDIITSIAEEVGKKKNPRPIPSYAYIHEGQIYIAPLV